MDCTILEKASQVFEQEAQAVLELKDKLNETFMEAIELIQNSQGRVVMSGIGKTGLIAQKIASTMASTGTPAFFLHPAEAIHGDLGMLLREDVVIALSNSGESEEIVKLVPLVKRIGCSVIAMTGNLGSRLAENSDLVLDVSVQKEACLLGLAPTSSTTAALAMGDALAMVLLDLKGFSADDFAMLHPGGELGRKLLVKVDELMRPASETPVVSPECLVQECLDMATEAKTGAILVLDDQQKLLGIFTDGDLRRELAQNPEVLKQEVHTVMTKTPFVIGHHKLAVEAARMMQDHQIDELPVLDSDGVFVGLLDIQDLLKAEIL